MHLTDLVYCVNITQYTNISTYIYLHIYQLLTTPPYVHFARRVSVTIPPSSGTFVHYDRPWFIFIVGFPTFVTPFLVACILVLVVATSSSMASCGYKRMRGSYCLCVVRVVAICLTSYLVNIDICTLNNDTRLSKS